MIVAAHTSAKIAGNQQMTPAGMRRIVLTTFGSLGDLHPYVAIALGLKARGHHPVIATIGMYKDKVEALGIEYRPLRAVRFDRPDADLMKQVMDARTGPEFIVRNLLMPSLRDAYEDTVAAADGADLLVSHSMTFATPLAAETKKVPWVSTVLAPMGFFSAYDPPALPLPLLSVVRSLGPTVLKPLLRFIQWSVRRWGQPWHQLRAELGLPPAGNPLFAGMIAPGLTLGLFSPLLGPKQMDWPPNTVVTGFPFFDQHHGDGLAPELRAFLDNGPAPIVFTLGT